MAGSVVPALVTAAEATPEEVANVCGAPANTVCRWVLEATGSQLLAEIAKFFVGWPLTILITCGVALLASAIGGRLIRRAGRRIADRQTLAKGPAPLTAARISTLTAVVVSVFSVVVWSIAIISILAALGVSLVPLLASAGVATAALGFGAQSIVRDFLAGFFMLAEGQFEIGDNIDVGEAHGIVEAITLRRTVLRGVDGTVWHVPNGVVQRVGNHSQQWSQAVLDLRVAPDTDLSLAQTVIEETARDMVTRPPWNELVLGEPEVLGVEDLGPDGAVIRLVIKTAPGQHWKLLRALRPLEKEAFDRAGIVMPPAPLSRPAAPAP
jgi:small conductance mechanosensitive channel